MKRLGQKKCIDAVQGGFTLVETLVAISILLLVVIGPMTIAAKGMQMGYYANEQSTAVFMAQEAIESIQKLRDDNALALLESPPTSANSWDWYNNLPDSCKMDGGNDNGCDLDITGPSYINCNATSTCTIEMDTNNVGIVIYGYGGGGWVPTIFNRFIRVEPEVVGGVTIGAKVSVTVTWPAHLFSDTNRVVRMQTWIYDHYQHFE